MMSITIAAFGNGVRLEVRQKSESEGILVAMVDWKTVVTVKDANP